jgi:hypothetical protein
MRVSRKNRRRRYLVARGAACVICKAHSRRAFRDPEEKDLLSPCTRSPLYPIWATSKRAAAAVARRRFETGETA